jgi:hypothetical protein
MPKRLCRRVLKVSGLSSRSRRLAIEFLERRRLLAAQVVTDQQDYQPGQTAIITTWQDGNAGLNFEVGERVRFQVRRTDGIEDFPSGNLPWVVEDGLGGFEPQYLDQDGDGTLDIGVFPDNDGVADGRIKTTWFVDEQYADSKLRLTAIGERSGARAEWDFTDSVTQTSISSPTTLSPITRDPGETFQITYSTTTNAANPGGGSTTLTSQLVSARIFKTGLNQISIPLTEKDNLGTTVGTFTNRSFTVTVPAGIDSGKYFVEITVTQTFANGSTRSSSAQRNDALTIVDPTGRLNGVTLTAQSGTAMYGADAETVSFNATAIRGSNGNFSGTYGVSGLPAGVTGSLSVTSFTSNGNNAFPSSTLSLVVGGTVPAGSYSFTVTLSSGGVSATATGTLIVIPAPLVITASRTKVYGDVISTSGTLPSGFSHTTLYNSDSITEVTLASDGFVGTAPVSGSPYVILLSSAAGTGLANYEITYEPGLLTVDRKAISFTIPNATKPYLEELALPPLSFPTGVNGETLAVFRKSEGNQPLSPVGDYPLTGTVDNGIEEVAGDINNYDVTLIDGILTATYERDRFLVLGSDANSLVGPWVQVIDRKPGVAPTTFLAYEPGFRGGVRVALGDLNGDGIDEIITSPGRGRAPEVRVFSLQGQSLPDYYTLAYASGMINGIQIGVGDVNGDGRNDLVTVPSRGASEVRVFLNGGNVPKPFGGQPRSFLAFPSSFIGGAVLAVQDVGATRGGVYSPTDGEENHDGRAEIIVGSGPGMRATVRTFEVGATTIRQVRETLHFAKTFNGGIASLAVGYANGVDRAYDLFVSAGNGGSSLVEVRDGKNNALLASFAAYAGTKAQSPVRIVIRDTNNDGVIDEIWTAQGTDGKSREVRRFRPNGAQVDAVFEQSVNFRGEYFIA